MKHRQIMAILFIAALILCTACSSSSPQPVSDPVEDNNSSDQVKKTDTVSEPVFSSSESDGATSVTISAADGAKIFFSTDGMSFQQYNTPVIVKKSVTVYAYAELDGVKSKTVGATFNAPQEESKQSSDNDSSKNDSSVSKTDEDKNNQENNNQNENDQDDSSQNNVPDNDNDNVDVGNDDDESSEDNLATYGTYSYKPDGMLPYFEELTLNDLYPDEDSLNKMVNELVRKHKEYETEHNNEYEPLDQASLGESISRLRGIYYKVVDRDEYYEYDSTPLDVENWLVVFENGVWALYDNNFKNILNSGALMNEPDNDWQMFSVDRKGELDVIWEFDSNDLTCNEGYYCRVYELWDYSNPYIGRTDEEQVSDTGVFDDTEYFTVDPQTEFFIMDRSLFGVNYNEFKKKLGRNDLMQPEDWPWWGQNLKVVYVDEELDTFACFFQNDRLVVVYRDSPSDGPGQMYYEAVSYFGNPDKEYEYWNGTTAYEWTLNDGYYQQNVETYDDQGHYRQQYTSFDYQE